MGDMSTLAQSLLDQDYQNAAALLVVVKDGTGKRRGKQPIEIRGLEEWAEGKTDGPEPIALRWYRRWVL